ncbi:cation transporter [Solemya velum gill symbiont]|uniref:Cation transporter n=6 Tax=Solemya velum gill symbiont TaxID=2340 RepID=A0A1T2CP17_SOVGS|nr:efflux RND transporter permease subunit [Solemya velum gill symbiont]OOY33924.1 cation transporter [Solemya velum gill symbiont]OOY36578.1 cation transporter [Solemya velum gill symbiont]OOY49671.1 cation transporter [Solemya velum gill symbiont]OOZ15124.1 cation transporter [Solemya velum gill symbiont]OOZ19838.1 cation transporter [Solemya velum gill symbiont]
MLEGIIRWSVHNRFLVLLGTLLIVAWGVNAVKNTPLDAIPDLSDVQVIIKTSYPGQSPRVVEEQVTYPLTTTMLSVPGANVVRGYSFFGDSYVYILFEDGTDIYWARARVLEYLNQAIADMPPGVQPRLGPDATGVGWIYSYALTDKTGQHDLAQLTSLQNWFLKYELQTVPGVSEIATVGGMVRQYQVVVDPEKLRAFGIPLAKISSAIKNANQEVGGSVIELAEAEYMIRTRGYLQSLDDIGQIPVSSTADGTPVLLKDVATLQIGPEMRRVVADIDGMGEVTGGIVVMRYGENALTTIDAVKKKLDELKQGLPDGVEIIETYDRSDLILRAVDNLQEKLVEEFIVVALVCLLFLFHFRSSFVAIVTLPIGVLASFIIMEQQGINANIMSLGGIAIAIGAMVDAAIVMIENAHKHLERYKHAHGHAPEGSEHWNTVIQAAVEVGPALFFSLLIITLSFLPVFTLEAQEGRLFSPLAYTKTYAMAASAGLAITLVPVLMGYLIRGKIPDENANPLNRFLIWIYRPFLNMVLKAPKTVIFLSGVMVVSLLIPVSGIKGVLEPLKWPIQIYAGISNATDDSVAQQTLNSINETQKRIEKNWRKSFRDTPWLARFSSGLGSEFMPELDEGDLMYMPTTLPGISIGKAQELLQQTDRLIKKIPEVKQVFGKIGRADTATDPAPLTMIETLIQLKPRDEWRPGVNLKTLIEELDATVKYPGVTNAWVMPIKTRIDMLATGIKTPVGIKVAGPDIKEIERIGQMIEKVVSEVPGTVSAYSERVAGGRYIDIKPDRIAAARYGINIADINQVVAAAIGGLNITETVEGLERYPVNLRFPREQRDSVEKLRELPLVTSSGAQVPLGQIASIRIVDGAPMLKSENARLNGWTFVDIRDVDLGSYVQLAQQAVRDNVELPAGYSITWSGQYEYMLRAQERLNQVVPFTLVIIFILLYMTFRRAGEALLVMLSLPFALVGGFWLIFLLDFNFSVAVGVGFIALTGVAAEFGVIMLVYLDNSLKDMKLTGPLTKEMLKEAIMEGAVMRVRPKAMTVAVIVAGLIPIFIGTGTGSEVMQRIAAPMIGGMITAPFLSLFVIPAIYYLWKLRTIKAEAD